MIDHLSRHLVLSADALESRVGDETIILHLGNDTYFGLDPLGTRIWDLLKAGAALPAIRDRLAEEYGVDVALVEADMIAFIDNLLAHDLLMDG